jgi:hypothetical protein
MKRMRRRMDAIEFDGGGGWWWNDVVAIDDGQWPKKMVDNAGIGVN